MTAAKSLPEFVEKMTPVIQWHEKTLGDVVDRIVEQRTKGNGLTSAFEAGLERVARCEGTLRVMTPFARWAERAHEKSTTTKKRREHAKAVAAADQQNARLRDKRKAAEDGMTASERAMATSGKKRAPKKKASGAKAKGKLSGLDAAAQILGKAKEPMGCKAIVEQAIEQKLWAPGGKTPAATLYSAILREIQNKGKDARFEKVERGRFGLRKGAG